jgi:aminoglycoside phosphotransferase (APT) family kinase protein
MLRPRTTAKIGSHRLGHSAIVQHVNKADITPELVSRLVASQFPQWAHLPVWPVDLDGWDNATFRLGADMSVRLPSAPQYEAGVDKEHRWLPVLAAHLPLPVPQPLAKGSSGCGFPRKWSVYRWLAGEHATRENVTNLSQFAIDLAAFLRALYRIDPDGGPPGGEHNFFRGASLAVYDQDTRAAIAALGDAIDGQRAIAVWEAALAAPWDGPAVWLHGDVSPTNLLTQDGRLSAVIDFGTCAVGDPACDTAIAWTFFTGESRALFKASLGLDEATWARGRGWALWKASIVLVKALVDDPVDAAETSRVISEILSEPC